MASCVSCAQALAGLLVFVSSFRAKPFARFKGANSGCMDTKRMTIKSLEEPLSRDEIDIQALIKRWARTVRGENGNGIRADHDSAILMFDVPPPFLSRGLDAYMATWETLFSRAEKPVGFASRWNSIYSGGPLDSSRQSFCWGV